MMTHPDFNTDALLKLLASAGGAFAIVFFFVIFQYIFKLEFACPCEPRETWWLCSVYIVIPIFIFIVIIIMVDKIFLEICTCSRKNCTCFAACKRIGSASFVSFLWLVTVLLDGDWWVCLATTSPNITVRSEQLACKKEPTSEESATILHLEFVSCVIGLCILSGVLLVWSAYLCFLKKHKRTLYKNLYKEYILEEADNFLKEGLKEQAKIDARRMEKNKLEQIRRELQNEQPKIKGLWKRLLPF